MKYRIKFYVGSSSEEVQSLLADMPLPVPAVGELVSLQGFYESAPKGLGRVVQVEHHYFQAPGSEITGHCAFVRIKPLGVESFDPMT